LVQVLIFKLEEESPSLLLHLLKVFAESAVFGSAVGLGCLLVVGFAQATLVRTALFLSTVRKK
jgi:hypothetical protein